MSDMPPVGAAVDATVLLDRRRLFEWVLDPLYSLGGGSVR